MSAPAPPEALPDSGRLPQNIAHYARALRRAGLPIGPGRIIGAIRAVEAPKPLPITTWSKSCVGSAMGQASAP